MLYARDWYKWTALAQSPTQSLLNFIIHDIYVKTDIAQVFINICGIE